MRFSVIIPLECHRGFAERCIRGWTMGQTHPRDDYELLIAAPAGHDVVELEQLTALLGPEDRLFVLPHKHDIPLVSEAASVARGEVLVITEAHCLPERDFLEQAAIVLDERHEWAGFSCRTIPLTHNLLSEIEAEMYHTDISRNMQQHEWLKVLKQMFVVRRVAYEAVGGVESQYGHFAEWVLAARLHRAQLKIGYDSRPAMQHLYIGDLRDLEEFTFDFSMGQMRFAQAAASDPCGDLFAEVPGWNRRHERSRQVSWQLLRALGRDLLGQISRDDRRLSEKLRSWPWPTARAWLQRCCLPRALVKRERNQQLRRARRATERYLRENNKPAAKRSFLTLMALCAESGRQHFLDSLSPSMTADVQTPTRGSSQWRAGCQEVFPTAGLHNLERHDRGPFRWSEPAAMVQLPAIQGECHIVFDWGLGQDRDVRFYLNRQPIPESHIQHGQLRTEITVAGTGSSMMLAWVCNPLASPGDERQLGLPVAGIAAQSVGRDSQLVLSTQRAA